MPKKTGWPPAAAKSVLDAGRAMFRHTCVYKAVAHRAYVNEPDERFSTQDCNACEARTGPKGLSGLGSWITDPTKEWTCSACGTVHHRDVNAANNILAAGHGRLAGGIPVLAAQAAALQG